MTAYYNEIDPFAAQWLRELIKAGHIAPGDVDERSIVDVRPDDLRGYAQCHFFAGIGVWSHALRQAGWPDDRPVWTGSCPCQPFSAAGKGAGFDDERHLWPAFFHLISECGPPVVIGEQVASKDGLGWLDLVQADMEGTGYAFGAVDTCAAGFGAPHIRQRLYWIGERLADPQSKGPPYRGTGAVQPQLTTSGGKFSGVADADHNGRGEHGQRLGSPAGTGESGIEERQRVWLDPADDRPADGLADSQRIGRSGLLGTGVPELDRRDDSKRAQSRSGSGREDGGLADAKLQQRQGSAASRNDTGGRNEEPAAAAGLCGDSRPGPTNGLWGSADWLYCRDGKWRPVEPGTFPLAHGAAARVGRLRGYGNAINAEQATAFIEAYLETEADQRVRLTGAFA